MTAAHVPPSSLQRLESNMQRSGLAVDQNRAARFEFALGEYWSLTACGDVGGFGIGSAQVLSMLTDTARNRPAFSDALSDTDHRQKPPPTSILSGSTKEPYPVSARFGEISGRVALLRVLRMEPWGEHPMPSLAGHLQETRFRLRGVACGHRICRAGRTPRLLCGLAEQPAITRREVAGVPKAVLLGDRDDRPHVRGHRLQFAPDHVKAQEPEVLLGPHSV